MLQGDTAALKTRAQELLAESRHHELKVECTARIEQGVEPLYLAYLYRASAVLAAGERIEPSVYSDMERGLELAGDDPDRTADALVMALAVDLHLTESEADFKHRAEELLSLAEANPGAAGRYIPSAYNLLGWRAMRRQSWREAAGCFDRERREAYRSPISAVETAMAVVNLALALLPVGEFAQAGAVVEDACRVQHGCVPFAHECAKAMAAMLRGEVVSLPGEEPDRPAARTYWLLACAVADACGYSQPEPSPATSLRQHIRATKMFAYSGLAEWAYSLRKENGACGNGLSA